jgi:hypothetical protein
MDARETTAYFAVFTVESIKLARDENRVHIRAQCKEAVFHSKDQEA